MQPNRTMQLVSIGGILLAMAWFGWPSKPNRARSIPLPTVAPVKAQEEVGGMPGGLNKKSPEAILPVASPDLPRSQLLRSIVTTIEGIQSTSDAIEQNERLNLAASSVTTADYSEVLGFLSNKKYLSPSGEELRNRILRRWSESDPQSAANWAGSQLTGEIKAAALKQIAGVWANLDLAAASTWARQLPAGNEHDEALAQIAYEAARTAPLTAMQLAVELPAGQARSDALAHVAGTWAGIDAQAATSWVKQVEDTPLRDRLLSSVALAWGSEDPEAAASLTLELIPPGRQQDDAVVGIMQSWAQKNPEQAALWVTRFPEGTLRQSAVENLVQIWADSSLEQVNQWLTQLEAGSLRDAASGALLAKLLPTSPGAASTLALGISNPALREQELENVGRAWLENDVKAARDWIASAPLSASSRSRLLASNAP